MSSHRTSSVVPSTSKASNSNVVLSSSNNNQGQQQQQQKPSMVPVSVAVASIQRIFRGHLSRRLYHAEMFLESFKNATSMAQVLTLQRVLRGRAVRRSRKMLEMKKQDEINAIQRRREMEKQKELEALQEKKDQSDSIHKVHLRALATAAGLIQTIARAKMTRLKKEIQHRRDQRDLNRLRNLLERSIIMRKNKVLVAERQVQVQHLNEKKAALVLQCSYRMHRARVSRLEELFGEMTKCLQRAWRMNLARKKLAKMKQSVSVVSEMKLVNVQSLIRGWFVRRILRKACYVEEIMEWMEPSLKEALVLQERKMFTAKVEKSYANSNKEHLGANLVGLYQFRDDAAIQVQCAWRGKRSRVICPFVRKPPPDPKMIAAALITRIALGYRPRRIMRKLAQERMRLRAANAIKLTYRAHQSRIIYGLYKQSQSMERIRGSILHLYSNLKYQQQLKLMKEKYALKIQSAWRRKVETERAMVILQEMMIMKAKRRLRRKWRCASRLQRCFQRLCYVLLRRWDRPMIMYTKRRQLAVSRLQRVWKSHLSKRVMNTHVSANDSRKIEKMKTRLAVICQKFARGYQTRSTMQSHALWGMFVERPGHSSVLSYVEDMERTGTDWEVSISKAVNKDIANMNRGKSNAKVSNAVFALLLEDGHRKVMMNDQSDVSLLQQTASTLKKMLNADWILPSHTNSRKLRKQSSMNHLTKISKPLRSRSMLHLPSKIEIPVTPPSLFPSPGNKTKNLEDRLLMTSDTPSFTPLVSPAMLKKVPPNNNNNIVPMGKIQQLAASMNNNNNNKAILEESEDKKVKYHQGLQLTSSPRSGKKFGIKRFTHMKQPNLGLMAIHLCGTARFDWKNIPADINAAPKLVQKPTQKNPPDTGELPCTHSSNKIIKQLEADLSSSLVLSHAALRCGRINDALFFLTQGNRDSKGPCSSPFPHHIVGLRCCFLDAIAWVHACDGNFGEGIEYLERALNMMGWKDVKYNLPPTTRPLLLLHLSYLCLKNEDPFKALEVLEECIGVLEDTWQQVDKIAAKIPLAHKSRFKCELGLSCHAAGSGWEEMGGDVLGALHHIQALVHHNAAAALTLIGEHNKAIVQGEKSLSHLKILEAQVEEGVRNRVSLGWALKCAQNSRKWKLKT